MNTLDAAFHLARSYPGGKEALAHRLGKSVHTFRHELTGDGFAKLGLVDAEAMSMFAQQMKMPNALAIINSMAANLGQMVLPLPQVVDLAGGDCMRSMAESAREFAELCAEVTGSLSDGQISDNELHRIERASAELVAQLQSLNAAVSAANKSAKAPAPAAGAVPLSRVA